jgi:hypothetical protein
LIDFFIPGFDPGEFVQHSSNPDPAVVGGLGCTGGLSLPKISQIYQKDLDVYEVQQEIIPEEGEGKLLRCNIDYRDGLAKKILV